MSCNTFEVLKSDGKAVISSLIASLFCEKIQLSVPPNSEVIIAETRHIATKNPKCFFISILACFLIFFLSMFFPLLYLSLDNNIESSK